VQAEEFTLLVEHNAAIVRAFIWRRSGGLDVGVSTPEDIAAEVWTVAWQRRDVAPAEVDAAATKAWLLQIARHVLANHIRKTQGRRSIINSLRPEIVTAASAEALVIQDETIREIFATLSPAEREVMALSIWEGLAPQEIAVVIGSSANAVSIRLHKARKKISDLLAVTDRNSDSDTPSK